MKKTVLAAMCLALCILVPLLFHTVPNGGNIYLPMHLPVLLCGMLCGAGYGLACGLLGPALSFLLTAMPAAAMLPAMMAECGTYGLVTGLMLKLLHTKNTCADLYLSQITAMAAGRLLSGGVKAVLFPELTMGAWIGSAVLLGLPGVVIQLALAAPVVLALMHTGVIPKRYTA